MHPHKTQLYTSFIVQQKISICRIAVKKYVIGGKVSPIHLATDQIAGSGIRRLWASINRNRQILDIGL